MDDLLTLLQDPQRLAALHRLQILDTLPDEAFDRLTRLAARVIGVPISLVTILGADKQYLKSIFGLGDPWTTQRETPLSHSLCKYTVAHGAPMIISDTRQNELVKDNPIIEELGAIAYAGVPLMTRDGYALGTFCLIQHQPRQWTEEEVAILQDLAASVMTEIELRAEVLHRQHINNQWQSMVDLMMMLHSVNDELMHELKTNYVVSIGLDAALRLSRADYGFIALIEDDKLRLAEMIGPYDSEQLSNYLTPQGGSLRKLLSEISYTGIFIHNVAAEPDYVSLIPATCSLLLVPLVSHDRIIGICRLETRYKDHFKEDLLDFVGLLAARLAAAIDNARLYEVAQAQLKELHEKNIRLVNLEQLKTQMIRIAAHDLRNPLGAVNGYLELMREQLGELPNEDLLYFVDMIAESVRKMRHITDDVLSIQRVETMLEDSLKLVDLRKVVERQVHEYSAQCAHEAKQLTCQLPDKTVKILGDDSYLGEAAANFITNAIKYSPRGSSIEVRLLVNDTHARFEVQDSGIGIPDEAQVKLFQPFYRVRSRQTSEIDGTGLGLYLVKQIIERCGGSVYFSSEYGAGSTFGFELPLAFEFAAQVDETD